MKIEDLWMSLRSVNFMIFFIIDQPMVYLKYSIDNIQSFDSPNSPSVSIIIDRISARTFSGNGSG